MPEPFSDTVIPRARLQTLFRKAQPYELPTDILLNDLGFYHWFVERSNTIYLVAQYEQALVGQQFNVQRHTGDRFRGRQCDLCRRFVSVSDLISIRSIRTLHDYGYAATYSYICHDLADCRLYIASRRDLEHLLRVHAP